MSVILGNFLKKFQAGFSKYFTIFLPFWSLALIYWLIGFMFLNILRMF